MSQSRKHRGYATQRILADYLRNHGFPYAEPVGAGRPGSDITGLVGLDIEVKARRGFNPAAAIGQLRDRHHEGSVGLAVLRLDGQGPASVDDWVMLLRLADGINLLRDAGYGDPR